ncbi:hypothetical protein TAEQ797_05350 [Taylorella equigenitalis]
MKYQGVLYNFILKKFISSGKSKKILLEHTKNEYNSTKKIDG